MFDQAAALHAMVCATHLRPQHAAVDSSVMHICDMKHHVLICQQTSSRLAHSTPFATDADQLDVRQRQSLARLLARRCIALGQLSRYAVQWLLSITTALITKKTVLLSNCPCWDMPLQSE